MKSLKIATLVCTALAAVAAQAAPINLPGGTLAVPGTSSTGASFTYSGTLTQADTLALSQSGNACLQSGSTYCTNGAGVITVAGSHPVGATTTFAGPAGLIPAGTWNYGALLMIISGVGTVQIWPANAGNGLGSATPPTSLTLAATPLSALGFPAFSQVNPTITFVVADTVFTDNSGDVTLSQPSPLAVAPVPTLAEWSLAALAVLVGLSGLALSRRRRAR
ncbi:MAG: IPTL-CTERM sorting domain-containing protein [Burkholderiaceae bacterium]